MISQDLSAREIKTCCAALYASDWARLLLGDSFHPGGLNLTTRLGELIRLTPGLRVLDVACGNGTSALHLAETFGCQVVGMDYSPALITEASAWARDRGLARQVTFEIGDAENLPFPAACFDAVFIECAYCTLPDKPLAAREFYRVLKPKGQLALSDLTRTGRLPAEMETLLAWIACLADAQSLERTLGYLESSGFRIQKTEAHSHALKDSIRLIRTRLLGAEIALKLNKIELPGVDLEQAKALARASVEAVNQGVLGYDLITAEK